MKKPRYNFKLEMNNKEKRLLIIVISTIVINMLILMIVENASDLFYIIMIIIFFVILGTCCVLMIKNNISQYKNKSREYNEINKNLINKFYENEELFSDFSSVLKNKKGYILQRLFGAFNNDDIYSFYIGVSAFTKEEVLNILDEFDFSKELKDYFNNLFINNKSYKSIARFKCEVTELYKIENGLMEKEEKDYYYGEFKYSRFYVTKKNNKYLVKREDFYTECGYYNVGEWCFKSEAKALKYINKYLLNVDKIVKKKTKFLDNEIVDVDDKIIRVESLNLSHISSLLNEEDKAFTNYFFSVYYGGHKYYIDYLEKEKSDDEIISEISIINKYIITDSDILINCYKLKKEEDFQKADLHFFYTIESLKKKMYNISKTIEINILD